LRRPGWNKFVHDMFQYRLSLWQESTTKPFQWDMVSADPVTGFNWR
jgi:hypothetical protein